MQDLQLLPEAINADSSAEQTSLEQLKCSDAFPKLHSKRLLSNGGTEIVNLACIDKEASSAPNNTLKSFPTPLPFVLLSGEYVQYYSHYGELQIYLTNFRLTTLVENGRQGFFSTPTRSIEGIESRDMFYLIVTCKDGRTSKVTFPNNESCCGWFKVLQSAIATPMKLEEIFAFAFYAWSRDETSEGLFGMAKNLPCNEFDFLTKDEASMLYASVMNEFKRLEFDEQLWRVVEINKDYKFCSTYPNYWIIPLTISDLEVEQVGLYRALRRVPAVVWRHQSNGATLIRSSQPEIGLFGWRKAQDEKLLQEILKASTVTRSNCGALITRANDVNCDACKKDLSRVIEYEPVKKTMLILDARSFAAAWANRAKGGGYESPEYYQNCEIQFLGLPNIHTIRKSFQQLRALCWNLVDPSGWLPALESTRWLHNLSYLLSAALSVVENIHCQGRPVLVHCSDGWDRTTQIVSLAKLCLDPYYRTMKGFKCLVEREWLEFGHKFSDRCGILSDDVNERAPVFLQWLDSVHQLLYQYPCAFEFNQTYLVTLAQHTYSGVFGTFIGNSSAERAEWNLNIRTFSIWSYLHAGNENVRNILYDPSLDQTALGYYDLSFAGLLNNGGQNFHGVIRPRCQIKDLVLWRSLYCPPISDPSQFSNNGQIKGMPGSNIDDGRIDRSLTKAHSCDNLITEALLSASNNSLAAGHHISGSGLVRTGSDSSLTNAGVDGLLTNGKLHSMSNSFSAGSSGSLGGFHRDSTERASISLKSHSHRRIDDDAKEVLKDVLESVTEDTLSADSCCNGNSAYRMLEITSAGGFDHFEENGQSLEKLQSESSFKPAVENGDLHLLSSKPEVKEETLMNGYQNGYPKTDDFLEQSCITADSNGLDCNGEKLRKPKLIARSSKHPQSFEIASDALYSIEKELQNNMQNSTSSTSTLLNYTFNGHSADSFSDSLVPQRRYSEMSTSTTEISDSHVSTPYNTMKGMMPARNGLVIFMDQNENPIACSSRTSSMSVLNNIGNPSLKLEFGVNGNAAESNGFACPADKDKDTKKVKMNRAKAGGAEKLNKFLQPSLGIFNWLGPDGLTKIPDDAQKRMSQISNRYDRTIRELKQELEEMRLTLYHHATHNRMRNGFRCTSNGSLPIDDKSVVIGSESEPRSFDSYTNQTDISWEMFDEDELNHPTRWIPDHAATRCMGCDIEFGVTTRKHHCRSCGKVFCGNCTSFETPVPSECLYKPARVCNACYNSLRCRDAGLAARV